MKVFYFCQLVNNLVDLWLSSYNYFKVFSRNLQFLIENHKGIDHAYDHNQTKITKYFKISNENHKIIKRTTSNRNNCDVKNNIDKRCVVVDHLSSMHEMLRRKNSKIKFNAFTFRDAEKQDLAESQKK